MRPKSSKNSNKKADPRPARQHRRSSGTEATPTESAAEASSEAGAIRTETKPFLIAGVGASAGGLEAFTQLLKNISADTGIAFVFVSHLDPNYKSMLRELLGRESKMPVVSIEQNMRVRANHVYVLPQNQHLTITQGFLQLQPRKKSDGHHPIDEFFNSLAKDQGNWAIGVLLSGTGTDGTTGLESIKAEGGITFVQTEASAAFSAMPAHALAAGCVDFALKPELIAHELKRIARHPAISQPKYIKPDSEADLHRLFALLRTLTGVDFSHYKHSTIKRRIMRRMLLCKFERLRDYVGYLEQKPSEVDLLFQDLLINVTAFFRDAQTFQVLKRKFFPKILKKNRNEPVRLWVPGCSTGEEVYSLAINLFEFMGKDPYGQVVQIFATDISETALAKARAGIYPESIASDIPQERLRRFFQKVDSGYQIAKVIRDSCVFARQNLIEDPPFSRLDLISCRNVLIYLGPLLQKKVVPILHYALKPGGYLVLGTSETIGAFTELFELVDKKNKIYVRRDGQARTDVDFLRKTGPKELEESSVSVLRHEEPGGPFDLHKQVDRILLSQFAPGGVVINWRMEVLQFRGQTGPYLQHQPGDASLNLLRMLRPEFLVDVRTAVNRAMKSNSVIRKEHISFVLEGKPREFNLEVILLRTDLPTSVSCSSSL